MQISGLLSRPSMGSLLIGKKAVKKQTLCHCRVVGELSRTMVGEPSRTTVGEPSRTTTRQSFFVLHIAHP